MDESISRAGKRILIVDDDTSVRTGLSRLLRVSGFVVTCAAGGEAALARLSESTPDLVLLDLSMPEIDGFEVLRRIRADVRTADIPVVMLSAMSDAAMRDRALNGGANDFLPKIGIDYATLPHRLMAHMGAEIRRASKPAPLAAARDRPLASPNVLRDDMPYVMIVDDARESVEPLATFLGRTGYVVRLVAGARDALAEITRNPPHVLLLDLLMPEMDGAMLLEVVRTQLRLDALPVVVMTGVPDSPLVQRVRDMNVSSVLTKGKATFLDVETALRNAHHNGADRSRD